MNQPAIERALGKLVVDGRFREAFVRNPAMATTAASIPLTDGELSASTRAQPNALAAFELLSPREAT